MAGWVPEGTPKSTKTLKGVGCRILTKMRLGEVFGHFSKNGQKSQNGKKLDFIIFIIFNNIFI